MNKLIALMLILFVLISVCHAEEALDPLGIYNTNQELLLELNSPVSDVIEKLGYPLNASDPYVIYDKDKLALPEIEAPVRGFYAENIGLFRSLLDAAPNNWDVLDWASATVVLEPYGLSIKGFVDLMNDITITEKTIKANGLSHDTLQTFVTMAELEESTYNSQQELYEYELDTPYSEWAEAVESSSAITGGMISLMAQEGGSIMYTLKYDGLSVSINNDRDMISENKPVRLSQYLQENLSDTKYDSVEARNRAIESKVNEYQEMYRAWRDLIIAHSTVDSVTIEKPGYITGRGDYVGQTVSEEMKWTIIDYFSGSLPLSREYMNSLNGEEKDGIDDLRYCSIRIGNKDYISSITVGIAWKTEQTDKAEELTVPENESSIEDSFIDDLLHGFTARDQVINENPDVDTYPSSKYISTHEAYILAEYEYIEKYRDAQFTDEMVKDASWLYLDGLDRQYEAVSKYYLADRDLYDQKWADGYYERCRALFLLSEKYDLRVKITLKDALNDMISVGEQVEISVDG